jgi:hypothetical protein
MSINDDSFSWFTADFTAIEMALWREEPGTPADLPWLDLSWQNPEHFWMALHVYWKRLQGMQTKSTALSCYDFYNDLVVRQKSHTTPAYTWFDGDRWQTWTYAELEQRVNSLAAAWEEAGVQAGETLVILYPQGSRWLTALLAGLRLGLVISFLPPQGNTFVHHRLENLAPQWLVMDSLYRHRLAQVWQEMALPNTPSSSAPTRQSHLYSGMAIIAQCFDPTSSTPDMPCPVDAASLYLGAMRDGVLSLGIKPGQVCASPGWHSMESQPALILAVLLNGGTWVHIESAELKKKPERLLEQHIDVLGVSRTLRDLLRKNPLDGEKSWRYWFRNPAESADLTLWQDFIQKMQLQTCYSGNLLWNATLGGAILFSTKYLGQSHHEAIPAAAMCWQFGIILSPDLPCLDDSGRIALGKKDKEEMLWTPTPHILALYLNTWHYLGNYPRGRAARTYPRQEILDVLATCEPYLALIETSIYGGDADPRQVLLAFGESVNVKALQARIETELGSEFLPDRIEVLPLLPKRNEQGGADQEWCQFHYLTGELYRRQRHAIYRCLSELKQKILL